MLNIWPGCLSPPVPSKVFCLCLAGHNCLWAEWVCRLCLWRVASRLQECLCKLGTQTSAPKYTLRHTPRCATACEVHQHGDFHIPLSQLMSADASCANCKAVWRLRVLAEKNRQAGIQTDRQQTDRQIDRQRLVTHHTHTYTHIITHIHSAIHDQCSNYFKEPRHAWQSPIASLHSPPLFSLTNTNTPSRGGRPKLANYLLKGHGKYAALFHGCNTSMKERRIFAMHLSLCLSSQSASN